MHKLPLLLSLEGHGDTVYNDLKDSKWGHLTTTKAENAVFISNLQRFVQKENSVCCFVPKFCMR